MEIRGKWQLGGSLGHDFWDIDFLFLLTVFLLTAHEKGTRWPLQQGPFIQH